MPTTAQRTFMQGQLFAMTLAATAQRSGLYTPHLSEVQRKPVQRALRNALEQVSVAYTTQVDEPQHVENIRWVAAEVSRKNKALLNDRGMNIGHAQKALNLYLKYLWCQDQIAEPPHCPIDSVILRSVPGFTQVRWTQLQSEREYLRIIHAAAGKATEYGLSLAEWELVEYEKRAA